MVGVANAASEGRMIRGPVLPQQRESLWPLVANRLTAIERGLTLVFEGLDCSGGQFGAVDGLARDAGGGPVLLVLATEGDSLLMARVLAASEFLERLGDSLVTALPEAGLSVGAVGRVVVVGTEVVAGVLERLRRLPIAGVHVCCLEPFRIAGSERFAVRWLAAGSVPQVAARPEFAVPAELQPVWQVVSDLCGRLDAAVKIEGDRYVRRVHWRGHVLGEVRVVGGALVGIDDEAAAHELLSVRHARVFGDKLLRAFVRAAGLTLPTPPAAPDRGLPRDAAARMVGGARNGLPRASESLRSVLAAAQLSPEEYSALGGPVSAAGGEADGAGVADDVARSVPAPEGSWPV